MEEEKLLPESNAEKDSKLNIDADNQPQEEISSSTESVMPEPEQLSTPNSKLSN